MRDGGCTMAKIRVDVGEIPGELLRSALDEQGYALLTVPPDGLRRTHRALDLLDLCLTTVGRPIQVFDNCTAWRSIGVDTQREPSRSEGVGESPLHMDFVNARNPPEYVMLYCERNDILGGGDTYLVPTAAVERLS